MKDSAASPHVGGTNQGKRWTVHLGDCLVSKTRPHGTDVAMAAPHDLRRMQWGEIDLPHLQEQYSRCQQELVM